MQFGRLHSTSPRAGSQEFGDVPYIVEKPASLQRRAALGAVWVVLAVAASKVLGIATYFVLARLLTPDDFGLVRFALILIGAFTVLQDLGVPASVIHSKRDIRAIGGTALTINLFASIVLFGLAILIAPAMASLADDDAVIPVLIVLAIGLVISALGSVQRAALEKELEFRRKFVPDVVPLIGSGVVSIVLAFLGFGAWSLVWGYLTKAILSSSLLWTLAPVRPWPRLQPDIARELLRYGKHMSLVSIIGFLSINADYFIVGHMLGTYELGLYTLAFLIANLPVEGVIEPAHKVMFSTYCKYQHDHQAMLRMYEQAVTAVSLIVVPISLAIFTIGPVMVPHVFGKEWGQIGLVLQVLIVHTVLRGFYRSFASVFAAVGRPDLVWRLNIIRVAILIPVMIMFIQWYGLVGIAIAYVVVAVVFVPINAVRMARLLGFSLRRLSWVFIPHVAGACIAGAATLVLGNVADGLVPGVVGAMTIAGIAFSLYVAVVVGLRPQIVSMLRSGSLVDLVRQRTRVA
jgi:O-antigen/teichoic acid export membrane protein